jgi:hypothetical protein
MFRTHTNAKDNLNQGQNVIAQGGVNIVFTHQIFSIYGNMIANRYFGVYQ